MEKKQGRSELCAMLLTHTIRECEKKNFQRIKIFKEAKFPNLKPATQSISIRLPVSFLEELKAMANSMDVPYQSLIKMLLAESVKTKYRLAG